MYFLYSAIFQHLRWCTELQSIPIEDKDLDILQSQHHDC